MNSIDFWARVDVGFPDECWPWLGETNHDGYGVFTESGKQVRAHRRAYELEHGPLPPHDPKTRSSVRHSCHNKPCCNPRHLSVGTHKENMQDSERDGKHQAHERHGLARLTEEQIDEIRHLRDMGVRGATIAADYKLKSTAHVYDIANRRKWA